MEEPFCDSGNFWYRKTLGIRKRGGYHNFRSKLCCLTVPKNFVGETFCVSENFRYRKNLWIRRGGGGSNTSFRPKKFLSSKSVSEHSKMLNSYLQYVGQMFPDIIPVCKRSVVSPSISKTGPETPKNGS